MYYFNCILLVDDDPISNILTEDLLHKLYICDHLYTYTNAQEALEFVEDYYNTNQRFPELILVDIKMPGLDGFQFVRALNLIVGPDYDEFKVSALTSSSDPSDRELMNKLGVSHYLIKPLTNQKVKELLRAIN